MIHALESLALAVVVVLGFRDGFRAGERRAPGNITDLTVVATTDSTATLTWTEVASGDGSVAHYDVRYGPAAGFAWWLGRRTPPDTLTGTTPAGGVRLRHVVMRLQPATAYAFQAVAFTGALNVNAVFSPGGPSNVAPGTTAATPPPLPPPPVPATLAINQAVVELVGQRTPLVASVRDQYGAPLPSAGVTWVSRTPAVATVDTFGVVLGVAPGVDTIVATAGVARGETVATIRAGPPPPPPPPPAALVLAQAFTFGGFSIPLLSGTYTGAFTDSTGAAVMDWSITLTPHPHP